MDINFQAAMREPWVRYASIGVLGIGIVWILMRNAGSTTTIVNGGNPEQAQLQAQQNQLSAAMATTASQNQFQLALDAQQNAAKLEALRIASQTETQQQVNNIAGTLGITQANANASTDAAALEYAGQIQLSQINAQNVAAQYASATTVGLANANAAVNQARINASIAENNNDTLLRATSIQADSAGYLANLQYILGKEKINADYNLGQSEIYHNALVNMTTSRIAADTQNHASDNSLFGNVVGSVLGAFF